MSPDRPRFGGLPAVRAVGALAALVLAGVAQARLEHGRPALWLFVAAAAAAIAATRGQPRPRPGRRPFRLALPTWPWLAGCVPGVACLAAAALEGSPCRLLALWWAGVGWLLAVGAAHALAVRRTVPRPADEWPRAGVALAYAALAAVALALRLVGLDGHPAFVEGDEVYSAGHAVFLLGEHPCEWFSLYWVGIPRVSLLPLRAVQLLFGAGLWNARLAAVGLGVLSVVATFAAGRRLIGNWPAWIAALLLAAAHTHLHWSRTVQPYIQTPALAPVVVWLLVRMWTGGSLCAWVGAAVALGVGTLTYQASQIFPILAGLTVAGWGAMVRPGWRAFIVSVLVLEGVALLTIAPTLAEMWRQPELVSSRPAALFTFSAENLAALGEDWVGQLAAHAQRTAVMLNYGVDYSHTYGAARPLVDAVTGALVPLAAALLLARLWTPLGWLCALWWTSYLVLGVFLSRELPNYYRAAAVLIFVALAAAAALADLWEAVRAGLRLPAWVVSGATLAVALAAAWANVDFYFRQYPAQRGVQHTFGFARLVCRYAPTHTVVTATAADGMEYVPTGNPTKDMECFDAPVLYVPHAAEVWDVDRLTRDDAVVLIVPTSIVEAHPGRPRGYRVVREYVDDSIRHPYALPLTVFELRRDVAR